MIQCVLEGMKKCIKKSVNYEKVKRVTQEEKENPALFHGQLVEVFRKYTSIDPSTSEGQSLLGQYFISQPSPPPCPRRPILGRNSKSYNLTHRRLWPSS